MGKSHQYYVAEIERLNTLTSDQAAEISYLKAQCARLKSKNDEIKSMSEMHSTVEYWKQKYDQLEKKFKTELTVKEANIQAMYKTEYVSAFSLYES